MGNRAPHYFTREEIGFIKKKIAGRSWADMAELFNRQFGLIGKKKITPKQMGSALYRYGLRNGLTGRFRPGQIPHNKGKKGCHAGSEKGWFKSGNKPWNYLPVGSERLNPYGYMEVKIRDPKTWKSKHTLIWEKARGRVPEGHVIIFADGNRLNASLGNLLMVSRRELAVMNRLGLVSKNKDLTKTGKAIADIKLLIAERGKGLGKNKTGAKEALQ